jgi:hypothetical protein
VVTLVSYTNAATLIGHINPGVGYWWTQTNGTWCLCLPASPVVSVFWPTFLLALLLLGGPTWLAVRSGPRLLSQA